jgi:hypothetical protein
VLLLDEAPVVRVDPDLWLVMLVDSVGRLRDGLNEWKWRRLVSVL